MDDLFILVKELNQAYLSLTHVAIGLFFHQCAEDWKNNVEHSVKELALSY